MIVNTPEKIFRKHLWFNYDNSQRRIKGLGLSKQEKNECFSRQSKHSFLQSVHTLAVLAKLLKLSSIRNFSWTRTLFSCNPLTRTYALSIIQSSRVDCIFALEKWICCCAVEPLTKWCLPNAAWTEIPVVGVSFYRCGKIFYRHAAFLFILRPSVLAGRSGYENIIFAVSQFIWLRTASPPWLPRSAVRRCCQGDSAKRSRSFDSGEWLCYSPSNKTEEQYAEQN